MVFCISFLWQRGTCPEKRKDNCLKKSHLSVFCINQTAIGCYVWLRPNGSGTKIFWDNAKLTLHYWILLSNTCPKGVELTQNNFVHIEEQSIFYSVFYLNALGVMKINAYFAYLAIIRPIFPIFFTESMVEQTEFAWQESSSNVSYCIMP